jgi:ABC-2 type transport system permease protein
MTIFFNNLKRIFRKKVNLIMMFVVPIAFIVWIASTMSSSSSTGLNIGFVDNDNTKLTSMLKQNLKQKGTIKEISQDQIKDLIIDKKIDTAIVIPKDFTKNILNQNNNSKIEMYSIKGVSNDSSIKYFVNSFTDAAKNIAKVAGGNSDKFYNGISDYEKGNFSKEVKYSDGKMEEVDTSSTALGYLVMSMIYLSTMITTLILKDKEYGVYNRMFANGIKAGNYMFQCILSFIVVIFIQIAAILLIMKNLIHSDLGPSVFNLFVVLALFGITSVALGVAICNTTKNLKQANASIALVSTPIAMLGGCFWPREIMGTTLQNISNFVPSTWVMDAAGKVISGSSLANVSNDLGVILLFAVIFFGISIVKKVDVAN